MKHLIIVEKLSNEFYFSYLLQKHQQRARVQAQQHWRYGCTLNSWYQWRYDVSPWREQLKGDDSNMVVGQHSD